MALVSLIDADTNRSYFSEKLALERTIHECSSTYWEECECLEDSKEATREGWVDHIQQHNSLWGYNDTEGENAEMDESESFYSVCALEDMPNLQKQDPEFAELVIYLSTGDLPVSDKSARKIVMIMYQLTVEGDILWHFYLPRARHKRIKLLPVKEFCVPLSIKLDTFRSYHEQGTSYKNPEAAFETNRQKYFWFDLYLDTQMYCKQCRSCLMAKKNHFQARFHSISYCEFCDKILADISWPAKTDSEGYRFCIMAMSL